ncbi:EamA family transporter RarD [Paenibacillus sp. TRM 82003]|uniref:EamA family transporter RarD n=1 Tax=Kineococcus sp. TRM81007 TaxID=2925831 RepID=UPI001F56CACC|nr:EamA family transporter RarD [Kineococcus sp. TRM81007]MCI2238845.1 EamA family transporter RarD [Kineococcus sp. TRM81007]MCI3924250.1 EamA family transporter RarD [Paenibacillus sp. TRM 82003]
MEEPRPTAPAAPGPHRTPGPPGAGAAPPGGLLAGAGAYVLWGLFPFYFHVLLPTGALELLAQRVVWSLALSVLLLTALRRWPAVLRVLRTPAQLRLLAVAAVAIAVNWGVYGLAVTSGNVLEASLGYFVNPLVTVLLGVLVLRERLRRTQWAAVAVGTAAVVVITADLGRLPWMALALAASFGTYGLLKNRLARSGTGVDPLTGLTVETGVLVLPALATLTWIGTTGRSTFTAGGTDHAVLTVLSGPATLAPLLLFALAAGRVPLTTIGLLQYTTPVLQFAAALVLGETMPASRWVGFALVWAALALLTADALRAQRRRRPALPRPRA